MKLKKIFVALAVLLVCQLRVYAWYDTYVSIDNLGYLLDKETKEAAPTSTGSNIPADATVLVIPESVEYEGITYRVTAILGIGDLFVRGYSQIKSLYIPSSITYVAKGAFQEGCTLEEIHITDLSAWCRIDFQGSPLWYTRRLFLDEEEIVDLVIPDDVTSIPAQAFRRLKNLRSVTFPEGLESIGDFAFQFCESLTAINLPKSLKHIGGDAFHGCYDVEYINILGDVVSMGECAFSNCRNLSTIIIKGNLGDLTNDQFLQLYNLKDIYCYAETPPTINSTTFDATPVENVTLHVPQTAIETYKKNTYWNSFGNIVALLPEELTPQTGIAINEENFPDEVFRAWLMDQEYGKDGVLTNEEIQSITKINVSNLEIMSLEGIKLFTALTELDVSACKELTELYCNDSPLTSLNVSDCWKLRILDCKNCQLKDLRISENTKLQELYCERNQLEDLILLRTWNLTTIDCSYNRIKSLDLSGTRALNIRCNDNLLEHLILPERRMSGNIYIYRNRLNGPQMDEVIKNLGKVTPRNPQKIYAITKEGLEYNFCTTEQIETARDKGWIICYEDGEEYEGIGSGQDIAINEQNFPDEFFRNYVKWTIDLGEDGFLSSKDIEVAKIIEFDVVPIDNSLNSYSDRIPIKTLKGVEFLTELEELRCPNCELKELYVSTLTKLKSLDCRDNEIQTLDLSQNKALEILICDANRIQTLDFSRNKALETLSCGNNELTSLDFSQNTELREVSCQMNQLDTLDVSILSNLQELSCSDCGLKELDLAKNTLLKTLYCKNNSLQSLDLSQNQALTSLWCSENQLRTLDLRQSQGLKYLGCNDNWLKEILLPDDISFEYDCLIYNNRLSGDALDEFISKLHQFPSYTFKTHVIRIASDKDERERNYATASQVEAAKARGWTLLYSNGTEYIGEEPTIDYSYRPVVEEGKTWMVGWYEAGETPSESDPSQIMYHYIQGDTIIAGQQCKQLWWSWDNGYGEQARKRIGAIYEKNRQVFIIFGDGIASYLLYDFYTPSGIQIDYTSYIGGSMGSSSAPWTMRHYTAICTIGKKTPVESDTYKGVSTEILPPEGQDFSATWMQGVGYIGSFNINFDNENKAHWELMSCTVGDEVLYYDALLMPKALEAKKKRLDFTHVVKAQAKAPQQGTGQEGTETLKGEYSDSEMFVRLNNLAGTYSITLTDEAGKEVYAKEVLTDNVLALSTDLLTYAPGTYTLTVENEYEKFVTTLNLTTDIASTPAPSQDKDALYDLSGRRLERTPQKGIYIQNGVKVLVK